MQPIILITCSSDEEDFFLRRQYCSRIAAAGGIPLIAPPVQAAEVLADKASALLLSGGGDAAPELYGEAASCFCGIPDAARDAFELELVQNFLREGKAIWGICRGMQMLNIAFGGTLYQDINEEQGFLQHMQQQVKNIATHKIILTGRLRQAAGEELAVNSFHHQAVKRLGNGLQCLARSEDGICEAFAAENGFVLGTQWHPEYLYDKVSEAVFNAFILAAKAK